MYQEFFGSAHATSLKKKSSLVIVRLQSRNPSNHPLSERKAKLPESGWSFIGVAKWNKNGDAGVIVAGIGGVAGGNGGFGGGWG